VLCTCDSPQFRCISQELEFDDRPIENETKSTAPLGDMSHRKKEAGHGGGGGSTKGRGCCV
jgi:hypothetical protein